MKITSYVSFLYCLCLMLASPTVQASEVRTAIFEGKPCINPPHVVGNYPATPFLFYIPTSVERFHKSPISPDTRHKCPPTFFAHFQGSRCPHSQIEKTIERSVALNALPIFSYLSIASTLPAGALQ